MALARGRPADGAGTLNRLLGMSGSLAGSAREQNMGMEQRMKVACDDGFEVVSAKEHELVQHVQMHLKELHQKIASHDEILKMAKKL